MCRTLHTQTGKSEYELSFRLLSPQTGAFKVCSSIISTCWLWIGIWRLPIRISQTTQIAIFCPEKQETILSPRNPRVQTLRLIRAVGLVLQPFSLSSQKLLQLLKHTTTQLDYTRPLKAKHCWNKRQTACKLLRLHQRDIRMCSPFVVPGRLMLVCTEIFYFFFFLDMTSLNSFTSDHLTRILFGLLMMDSRAEMECRCTNLTDPSSHCPTLSSAAALCICVCVRGGVCVCVFFHKENR